MEPATKQIEQYQLRMPGELREKLKARAAANRRSMNSEIIVVLERAVGAEEGQANGDQT